MKTARLAFVNTRLPGMTFLARDLRALMGEGVIVDLYLFDLAGLDSTLRCEIEAAGGRVEKIDFPWSGAIARAVLGEIIRRPARLLGSLAIGLWASIRSPAEGLRALAVLPASLALARRIEATGATQAHGLWAGVPGVVTWWMWRHRAIPYTLSGHAWDILDRTHLLRRKVAASRGMVVCSAFAQNVVREKVGADLARRVQLVHHGLDLDDWAFSPDRATPGQKPPLVLAVGNLVPKKGYDTLVQACGMLKTRGFPFRCEIIGPEREDGPRLRALIAELGLTGEVRLAGARTEGEVRTRMHEASAFACPSVMIGTHSSDGIPNVVLEAMAVGLPVVATDAGGLSEVVHDGETALRVPQRDAAALAAALERAITDREGSRSRAAVARRMLEESFEARTTARGFLGALSLDGERAEGSLARR